MHKLRQLWEMYGRAESVWGFITSDWVRTWILPFLGPVMIWLLGLVSSVPLPYLATAAFVSFAAIATGLLRFDEWRSRTSPKGRLRFQQPAADFKIDRTKNPQVLKSVSLGFFYENIADFPLFVEIEEVFCHFDGRVSVDRKIDISKQEIPPRSQRMFFDAAIPVDIPVSAGVKEGELQFKLSYRRINSRRKQYIEYRIQMIATYNTMTNNYDLSGHFKELKAPHVI